MWLLSRTLRLYRRVVSRAKRDGPSLRKNAFGQVINWEWSKGSIQKLKRVAKQVTVEVNFSDGKRDVVLSTLAYNTDWVLLCEKKEGAAAGKKSKKQTSKKLGASASRAH